MADRICVIRQRDYYELAVRRETETLRDAGYEVDLICLAEEGHPREEVINDVHLYRLPLVRKKGSVLRYFYDYFSFLFLAAFKVAQLHLRKPYKVIQVNTMPDFLVFATLIPKLLGAKVIVFMKEPTPELGKTLFRAKWAPKVLAIVEQLALRYADMAFTVTQQLKDVYVSRGANPDKIKVVLNGPDPHHFAAVSGGVRPDPNFFTLICHGAVEERYGHDTILEAVSLARQSVPNLRLRLIGTGSYVAEVNSMIKSLKIDDCVEYLGWISEEELANELHRADVGLVAQKSTPYSNLVHTNKMYEYFIFDKPAIVSRLDSTYHYFGDDSLFYFEADRPDCLAEVIVEVAGNPEMGRTKLAKAKELYQNYSWSAQSQIFLDSYRHLLGLESESQRAGV